MGVRTPLRQSFTRDEPIATKLRCPWASDGGIHFRVAPGIASALNSGNGRPWQEAWITQAGEVVTAHFLALPTADLNAGGGIADAGVTITAAQAEACTAVGALVATATGTIRMQQTRTINRQEDSSAAHSER